MKFGKIFILLALMFLLFGCAKAENVAAVESLIKDLPKTITMDNESQIEEIRNRYSLLTEEEQNIVTASLMAKFTDCDQQLQALYQAQWNERIVDTVEIDGFYITKFPYSSILNDIGQSGTLTIDNVYTKDMGDGCIRIKIEITNNTSVRLSPESYLRYELGVIDNGDVRRTGIQTLAFYEILSPGRSKTISFDVQRTNDELLDGQADYIIFYPFVIEEFIESALPMVNALPYSVDGVTISNPKIVESSVYPGSKAIEYTVTNNLDQRLEPNCYVELTLTDEHGELFEVVQADIGLVKPHETKTMQCLCAAYNAMTFEFGNAYISTFLDLSMYDTVNCNGFEVLPMPYTINGVTFESLDSDERYLYFKVTNHTGKTISETSTLRYESYANMEGIDYQPGMQAEMNIDIQLDDGESGIIRIFHGDNKAGLIIKDILPAESASSRCYSDKFTSFNDHFMISWLHQFEAFTTFDYKFSYSAKYDSYTIVVYFHKNDNFDSSAYQYALLKAYDHDGNVVATLREELLEGDMILYIEYDDEFYTTCFEVYGLDIAKILIGEISSLDQ